VRIRKRKRRGLYRESEGFIVPLEDKGQHNPVRGKGPCFVHATGERRMMEIAAWLSTPQISSGRHKGSSADKPNRETVT